MGNAVVSLPQKESNRRKKEISVSKCASGTQSRVNKQSRWNTTQGGWMCTYSCYLFGFMAFLLLFLFIILWCFKTLNHQICVSLICGINWRGKPTLIDSWNNLLILLFALDAVRSSTALSIILVTESLAHDSFFYLLQLIHVRYYMKISSGILFFLSAIIHFS